MTQNVGMMESNVIGMEFVWMDGNCKWYKEEEQWGKFFILFDFLKKLDKYILCPYCLSDSS
jgi:hypothetical protein